MAVEFRCGVARWRPYCAELRAHADALLLATGLRDWELSVVLVSDRTIRRLNRDFRDKDEATDVLSFPQMEADELRSVLAAAKHARRGYSAAELPPNTLGDVVISVETAKRQAHALGVPLPYRLDTLLIHGLLHLLGYDHEKSAAQARRMFARERELAAHLYANGNAGRAGGSHAAASPDHSPAEMPVATRRRTSAQSRAHLIRHGRHEGHTCGIGVLPRSR